MRVTTPREAGARPSPGHAAAAAPPPLPPESPPAAAAAARHGAAHEHEEGHTLFVWPEQRASRARPFTKALPPSDWSTSVISQPQ
jgi:hypothetical protein